MGCKQTKLVTFRGSLCFVVVVKYTLPVVLHILWVDGVIKGLDTLLVLSSSLAYHGM